MDELYQIIDRNVKFTLSSPEYGLAHIPFDQISTEDMDEVCSRLNRHISSVKWRMKKLADTILVDGRLLTTYMRWIYMRDGYIFKCPDIIPILD